MTIHNAVGDDDCAGWDAAQLAGSVGRASLAVFVISKQKTPFPVYVLHNFSASKDSEDYRSK